MAPPGAVWNGARPPCLQGGHARRESASIRRSWRFVHNIVEALKFPLLAAALTCAAPVLEDVSYAAVTAP
jgi:hypothetical protein